MSIALLITDRDLTSLKAGIEAKLGEQTVRCWPDIEQMADAEFIVAWRQPENIWQHLPKAKVVCSLGAGVDGLINDPFLPKHLSLIRIVDESLSEQMAEFVLASLLLKNCRLDCYQQQQHANTWTPLPRLVRKKVTLLGVGKIGLCVAKRLKLNGFDVTGWARAHHPDVDFDVYLGQNQLAEALGDADYVVSTLPATVATHKMIDRQVFDLMPKHCCFINVGRGQTVNEHDLLTALNTQQIDSAILDVFQQEPLSKEHPFWQHEKVIMTPHIAAITDQKQVVEQIVENYLSFKNNRPLINQVNPELGY